MDPMTQSTQISSSQGFADGQNCAAKESKLSDSFLSSSPVSLIQSPQDKRVVLGSDKPCEGIATSLRFPSQPGSFTPGHYGSEAGPPDEPDSPIKTSPVSERIKALEALAAKKKEPDFRSDGGFSQFRDRHYEKSPTETQKSPTEKITLAVQEKGSTDQESPESPFEVLGDLKQVNEFEETEEWMKAHLPPVPDFDAADLSKGTLTSDNVTSKEKEETDGVIPDISAAFAGVPDAFMDSPNETSELKDESSDSQKQPSIEDESEFDLSFLPTAYMWEQEKSGAQGEANLHSELSASPAPPAGFGSPSPPVSPPADMNAKLNVSEEKKTTWTGDLEPTEASEAESSGESDDTVIEDSVTVPASVPLAFSDPAVSNDPTTTPASTTPDLPPEEKESPPPKNERRLMQVPTINVIETDEPNYSEEEMEMELEGTQDEDYEVEKVSSRDTPKTPEPEPENIKKEPAITRPLETEFMEGYSPPSSPVDSDVEYSPKHKTLKSLPETVKQESTSKINALPSQTVSKESVSDFSQDQSEKTQTTSNKVDEPSSPMATNEEVDFPDNDDEWSDEIQDILFKPCRPDLASKEPVPCTQSKMDEKSNTAPKEAYMETASPPKTSFMQDDTYDRQSFDYDYDVSSPPDDINDRVQTNAKHGFHSDPSEIHMEKVNTTTAQNDSQDTQNLDNLTSLNDDETLYCISEKDFNKKMTTDDTEDTLLSGTSLPAQNINSTIQEGTKAGHNAPDATSKPDSTDLDGSIAEPTDSFVDFMRECLKSRQDEEPDEVHKSVPSKTQFFETDRPPSQSPPTMVMDLEQEQLTISALKELGSSQEEEEEEVVSFQLDKAKPSVVSIQQSSLTSVPNPPCSQSQHAFDSSYSKEEEAIDEWVAEAYHLAEHVLTAILTHLSVKDLIHWQDPKKSGLVFGLSMLVLLSLAAFSVISVVSYLLLALLCVTITFRIYKSVVQAVQKSSEGHPFKALIDKDVSIPPETFRKHVDASLTYINRALKQMSRLFLVEDLVDSLKLAVVMWLLTYVGAVFNGITILILADILLFAVPPVYEKNKTQIDQYIDLARTQVNTTIAKLQEKLPGAMKRSKTE